MVRGSEREYLVRGVVRSSGVKGECIGVNRGEGSEEK